MSWECGTHKGEDTYIYKGIVVGKSEGVKQLERSVLGREDNVKICIKK